MTNTNGAKQSEGGVAGVCLPGLVLCACAGLLLSFPGGRSGLAKASVSSLSAWRSFRAGLTGERSGAERLESDAASWVAGHAALARLATILTLGWFVKPMRLGAVGGFGVARGARRRSDPAKCQTDFLAAITWPSLYRSIAAVLLFCGGREERIGDVIAGLW